MNFQSWGRVDSAENCRKNPVASGGPLPEFDSKSSYLTYGLGRSYGDVPLLSSGEILTTQYLDRLISFDQSNGLLECGAGLSIADLIDWSVAKGWFVPVTPGTKYVTIGGAVANDVHGKNHHHAGTFGCHVNEISILRSDQGLVLCSPTKNPELFNATIGGLGLTGLIISVKFQLEKIDGPYLDSEIVKFNNLGEFFAIDEDSKAKFSHTMAWVDCLAKGKSLGRGLYMRGNWAKKKSKVKDLRVRAPGVSIPVEMPNFLLNPLFMNVFNTAYYHKQLRQNVKSLTHYEPFFYPLDAVGEWNKIYGKRGFYQFQFVLPDSEKSRITAIFETIANSKMGSFLAVLKRFGGRRSPGILSFPEEGVTLALDFANLGDKTLKLLRTLSKSVREGGGRIYPAKDAMMSEGDFKDFFPNYKDLEIQRDPKFTSNFWERVGGRD